MGLINILLGAKKAERSIAEIDAALARLVSERNIAKEAIASALVERDSLLLEDESDARIGKLNSSADKARLTVERCDKLEPVLLQELATARGVAKAGKLQGLRSRYDTAATDFSRKARAALEAFDALARIRGEAQETGFAAEAATFAVAPNILKPDLLGMFEFEIERSREAGKPRPAAAPKPVAPKLASAKPVARAAPKQAPKPALKPPFVPKAEDDGSVRITVLRPGLEVAGRSRRAAEVVSLPFADGKRVVESGGAEFSELLN